MNKTILYTFVFILNIILLLNKTTFNVQSILILKKSIYDFPIDKIYQI
jgi:hypothetical protein